MTDQFLEDLEQHLDPAIENDLLDQWHRFWEGRSPDPLFVPQRTETAETSLQWPGTTVNDALEDTDQMVLQQYGACLNTLRKGGGAVLNVRANYGVGILPTLFGTELFLMDGEANCLPNVWPLGEDRLLAALDNGIPELDAGFGAQVFETGARFMQIAQQYPAIGEFVHIYHPDLQGPMDVCELLWGSDIFLALFDKTDLVKQCLELVTETYLAFMARWNTIVPPRPDYSAHWGLLLKGSVVIRDDSAMNLSPDMFDEFIAPFNQRLLNELGGGMDHFCGRGDHFISRLADLEGLAAVNMSQPEYNDMETIFANTVDRGIRLLGLARSAGEQALAAGRDLGGRVHCN